MTGGRPDLPAEAKNQATTRDEALAHLESLKGKRLKNLEQNIEATISSRQAKKMVSGIALGKSKDNGFSEEEHYLAAANVDEIFLTATLREWQADKKETGGIEAIGRFEGAIKINGHVALAKLTLKNTVQHGHKIYTLELTEIKKAAQGNGHVPASGNSSTSNGY